MLYSAGCTVDADNDCTWGLASLINDEGSDYGCNINNRDDISGKAVLIPYEKSIGNCSVYEKVYIC